MARLASAAAFRRIVWGGGRGRWVGAGEEAAAIGDGENDVDAAPAFAYGQTGDTGDQIGPHRDFTSGAIYSRVPYEVISPYVIRDT